MNINIKSFSVPPLAKASTPFMLPTEQFTICKTDTANTAIQYNTTTTTTTTNNKQRQTTTNNNNNNNNNNKQ
jgi:hypothetical protein